jgi:GNAT superfamily N-acetyltransferase
MPGGLVIRDAARADARRISDIGRNAMPAQYQGLVDPVAVQAAIEQTYGIDAIAACIDACARARGAEFLVAEVDDDLVGYLHFDSFGPEPELHRLYVDARGRGGGIGGQLMQTLHARLAPGEPYMLLVLEGNDRAVCFYQRHGLVVAGYVDGLRYYGERMGVMFPAAAKPFRLVLMRRTRGRNASRQQL